MKFAIGLITGIIISAILIFLMVEPYIWKSAKLEIIIQELLEDKVYLNKIIADRNKSLSRIQKNFDIFRYNTNKELTELGKWDTSDTLTTR